MSLSRSTHLQVEVVFTVKTFLHYDTMTLMIVVDLQSHMNDLHHTSEPSGPYLLSIKY